MEVTTKIWLLKKRKKKNGKYPVKIKVIFDRKIYFYQTGIDLTEEEFEVYHSSKNLKKQFEEITYFLKKADKIVRDLGRNFSWREFDALFYNRKIVTQQNYQSQSINLFQKLKIMQKNCLTKIFSKLQNRISQLQTI